MNKSNHRRGYIASLSAVLIAGILTMLALTGSARSLLYINDQADLENHEQASLLARSCGFIAVQALLENPASTIEKQTFTIADQNTCTVDTSKINGNVMEIFSHSHVKNTLSIYKTTAQILNSTPQITSQVEETSIPP